MKKLRGVCIGAGYFSHFQYEAWQRIPEVAVVAFSNRDPIKASAIQEKFGSERRTQIIDESGEFRIEDLIAEEDMAITVTHTGYVKRTAITSYRNQQRGGKGRIGMRFREEDFVDHLFIASTHDYLLVFSDRGRAYWLKVHEIPDVGPDGRGKAIANLVSMGEGEKIASLLAGRAFE